MSSARKTGSARAPRTPTGASKSSDDQGPAETPGLRGLVQHRLLDDVFGATSDKFPGWKVLILDEHSMHIISSAVGMYDIMERKVTLVESLSKKRAPFPDMGAIYLLAPTDESVDALVADFSAAAPLYGQSVFLFFLTRLPERLLDKIKSCRPLLKRVKCLSEVNVDFLAKEERAFDLDLRDTFKSFYLRRGASSSELKIAERLVTVCATLNEYPHIRYKESSAICSSLSHVFHKKMDEYVSQNPSWWYHGGPVHNTAAKKERGTLLLLDRADDILSPLMHDFHYQSMVHDLLEMDGDKITYSVETGEGTEAKDVLLDEKDTVWVEMRGHHIAKVIEVLSERIREIMNSSTGSSLGSKTGGNMSLSQMAAAMKALPEYKEVMSKLSQHMALAHDCMGQLRTQSLMELADLEQTSATGKNEDGKSPKMADLIDEAERLLMEMKDPAARLRLILILSISQSGLRQQDRRRLMNVAELTRQDMKTMNSLEIMGHSGLAVSEKKTIGSLFGGRSAATADDSDYAACRYTPPLKSIVEDLLNGELSMEEYPSVLPMPDQGNSGGAKGIVKSVRGTSRRGEAASARKSKGASSSWAKSSSASGSRGGGGVHFTGGRSIVFTVGGMSYSELRTCREVTMNEQREIVVGSTAFISPRDFLSDLGELGRED